MDETDIQKAVSDLKELLTRWRGIPCFDLDLEVNGDRVRINAQFVQGIGRF
jgi:hypothetical protein